MLWIHNTEFKIYQREEYVPTARVADLHSYHPNPDPAFRLKTDPEPIRIRIQGFNDQKLKKNYSWKKLTFFWIKNYNLPIPRPPYRTFKLQKKPSALKRGHP
jgi:hypothetical protein